jgi:phosphate transport system permease protein
MKKPKAEGFAHAIFFLAAGTVAQLPENIFSSGRTLAVHLYSLSSEGLHMDKAYASAVILLVLAALINTLSFALARKLSPGGKSG